MVSQLLTTTKDCSPARTIGGPPGEAGLGRNSGPDQGGQTQQAFDAQAKLDGCIQKRRKPASFARARGKPPHVFVQPNCQRTSGFAGLVVLPPVRGPVSPLARLLALFCSHYQCVSEHSPPTWETEALHHLSAFRISADQIANSMRGRSGSWRYVNR